MALEILSVSGLRGFADEQQFRPAQPNGQPGSGLTVVVGPNGGGKSTVLEALRAAGRFDTPSFSTGKRNVAAGDFVRIRWRAGGQDGLLASVRSGSSETQREPGNVAIPDLLHLPSRRAFTPFFGRNETSRDNYQSRMALPTHRSETLGYFSQRLVALERSPERGAFNNLVTEIAGKPLDWSIDQEDSGQHFLKVQSKQGTHNSDGLGEGTVSVLFLADALYDSKANAVIVIDEPELSLHPDHQRRLRKVLSRFSSDRQIIIATHSPYFVDWIDISRGGEIVRIYWHDGHSIIAAPHRATLDSLAGLATDLNNPHVLGLNASEVFFLEDRIILTEGQEDVLVYQAMSEELQIDLHGTFFGWGTGGADKMAHVVRLLEELGYRQVVGILDGNRADVAKQLATAHGAYRFIAIPADDVRTKAQRQASPAVQGLAESNGKIAAGRAAEVQGILTQVNEFFGPRA